MIPTVRLFLGLWPTDAARQAVVEHALLWQWPGTARMTRPERMHITLHFIGSVPAPRVDELRRELDVGFESFELAMDAPELWRGGLAVLCAAKMPARLSDLHARLAARLQSLHLPVESRPFRPHVTLARDAWGARPPADEEPVAWAAHAGYALVRSLPGGQGYETIQRFA